MYLSLTPTIDALASNDHLWRDQAGHLRTKLDLGDDLGLFGNPLEVVAWLRRRADELEADLGVFLEAEGSDPGVGLEDGPLVGGEGGHVDGVG